MHLQDVVAATIETTPYRNRAGAPATFMVAGGRLLELNVQRPAQAAWFAGDCAVGGV